MKGKKIKHRHTFYVDRGFQLRLIMIALLPFVVILSGMGFGLLWLFHNLRNAFHFEDTNSLMLFLMEKLGPDYSSGKMFSALESYALTALIVFAVLVILYIYYIFLIFSNRIAGPMYRIDKTLSALADGDLSVQITLREKDEFQYAADNFNGMIRTLRDRVRRIAQLNRHLSETFNELEPRIIPENREDFTKLRELNAGIGQAIHEFKTE